MAGISELVGVVGGVMGVGVPILQAKQQHKEALEQADILSNLAYQQADALHHQAIQLDMLAALREHSRDVWAQKNLTAQTLMIIDTLMFSCGFALIIEGMPPEQSPSWVLHMFSFCIGGALGTLFLSVWLAMKMQIRMAKFNVFDAKHIYRCGKMHINFSAYYLCHCRQLTYWGFRLFYVGTFMLVLSASVVLVQRFISIYTNPSAGWLFMGILVVTVIAMVVLEVLLPANTRTAKTPLGSGIAVSTSAEASMPRARGKGKRSRSDKPTARGKGLRSKRSGMYPASMSMV